MTTATKQNEPDYRALLLSLIGSIWVWRITWETSPTTCSTSWRTTRGPWERDDLRAAIKRLEHR